MYWTATRPDARTFSDPDIRAPILSTSTSIFSFSSSLMHSSLPFSNTRSCAIPLMDRCTSPIAHTSRTRVQSSPGVVGGQRWADANSRGAGDCRSNISSARTKVLVLYVSTNDVYLSLSVHTRVRRVPAKNSFQCSLPHAILLSPSCSRYHPYFWLLFFYIAFTYHTRCQGSPGRDSGGLVKAHGCRISLNSIPHHSRALA